MSLMQWFEDLADREKILVSMAGALTIVAVLVIAVVRPLVSNRNRLNDQVADRRAVLMDLERVAARFGDSLGGNGSTGRPSDESLVVLIDRTTRSRGLGSYLRRNEPDGAASIRLRFENAPFDDLVGWLAELNASHGINVTNLSAEPASAEGRVNSSLQLSRGPVG